MAKLVSKTYGDALFELAVENGRMDEFLEEAQGILMVLKEHEDLSKLMDQPKIVKEERMKIIEIIFTGRVSQELVGLMRMLIAKDHFGKMASVFVYFIAKVKEYKNIGIAYVTSALELTDAQKVSIVNKLVETTKYMKFEMHYEIDSALIGGMKIQIGDRVVDSSIQTKLQKMTRELSKLQLKVGECAS